jgi:hypothetical protein
MTFREQVRFALYCAAVSIVAGLVLVAILWWWGVKAGDSGLTDAAIEISGLFIGVGAALIMFGGLLRSVHRWLWHHSIRHSVLWDGYYPWSMTQGWSSPFWRFWLHIDREGNDLDARP